MTLSYRNAMLGQAATGDDAALVTSLQHDLRRLGYLANGIDGTYGTGTRRAVRCLQHDLLENDGQSTARDGNAPVAIKDFNRGVRTVTGIVDAALADSIEALLGDARIGKLPSHDDPVAANRAAMAAIATMPGLTVPTPFLLAIIQQETGGRHYAEPADARDPDNYLVVGLDRNGAADAITSRGYGIAQYTFFHHTLRPEEVTAALGDPLANVAQAAATLADKFNHEIIGTAGSDDRIAVHGNGALRTCRYPQGDARRMTACRDCAASIARTDISAATPLYPGSRQTYGEGTLYAPWRYEGVAAAAGFPCDWPYAVRRYNGAGPDSFNYQARILLNLLAGPAGSPAAGH